MRRTIVFRPMRRLLAATAPLVGAACVVAALSCAAAPTAGEPFRLYEAPHTSIRLMTGGTSEHHGGGRRIAGIEIVMEPGWKTYWRSPGEGIAPSFSWDESANLKAVEVLWPAPVRFGEGEDTSVGYEGRVVLPVLITPESADSPVSLNLDVAYGVCKEICMPVEAQLSIDLDAPVRKADRDALIAALGRVPLKQEDGARCPHRFVAARLVSAPERPLLRVETAFDDGAAARDVIVELPQEAGLGAPRPDDTSHAPGRAVWHFPLAAEGATIVREKPVTVTTVSDRGSCESRARVE